MADWHSFLPQWLAAANSAPSAHNTQPWLCKMQGENLAIFRDPAHTLGPGDPTLRQTFLGLGTFVENLIIAAAHESFQTVIQEQPFIHDASKPVLVLSFVKKNGLENFLYKAIAQRHTNRGLYKPDLPTGAFDSLNKVAPEPGIAIHFIEDSETKKRIAELIKRGIFIGLTMTALKEELSDLVSFKNENFETGLQVESMTQQVTKLKKGKEWLLHELDPQAESEFNYQKFATAPLMAIITGQSEGPQAWLAAGQTLEKLLLTAAGLGLNHCISAAPVEVPTLAPLLRQEIPDRSRPLALVRLGVPENPNFTIHSERRSIAV